MMKTQKKTQFRLDFLTKNDSKYGTIFQIIFLIIFFFPNFDKIIKILKSFNLFLI